MDRFWTKGIALLLSILMMVGLLPLSAIAEDEESIVSGDDGIEEVTVDGTYCGLHAHTHNASCYAQVLICGKEQGEGAHTHTDECYLEETVLTCELEEVEPHTHTEACYDEEGNRICELEETEGHTHTEDCYTTTRTLICETEESAGHIHTNECFENVLVCEQQEHVHTLACYSDPTADVETAYQWGKSVADAELTGEWAHDVIEVAKTQLGYTESSKNYTVTEDGRKKGYTRYGDWYGEEFRYSLWCAGFVSFCLSYAGVEGVPLSLACGSWVDSLSEAGLYRAAGEYTPKPGDIVFFHVDPLDERASDHVGLVLDVSGDSLVTIEGNRTNTVETFSYTLDEETIVGYGALPENPNYVAPAFPGTVLTYTDGGAFEVRVKIGEHARIPENAELFVTELSPNNDRYADYLNATATSLEMKADDIELLRTFDIKIIDPKDPDHVYEPKGTVDVEIVLLDTDFTQYKSVDVLHFTENRRSAALHADNMSGAVSGETIRFATDSFSVYAVACYTLEQLVEASDGNTYRISVQYDKSSGIPMEGTALSVREIDPDSAAYELYRNESIKAVGTDAAHIGLTRVFDIKIVDAEDESRVYEPKTDVTVSITLVGETLSAYQSVNVLHFADDEATAAQTMRTQVSGDSVRFTTDGFSVYAVSTTVFTRTIKYYNLNEYLEYEQMALNADNPDHPVYEQIVRSGERAVAPQNPVNPQDQEATFSGWYIGTQDPSDPGNLTVRYDFDAVPNLTEDEHIYLYAKYSNYVYLILHDQYDEDTGSFPIAFTRRVDLAGETEEDWYVDLLPYSVAYEDPDEIDDNKMVFVGWSAEPITIPGASLDDSGAVVSEVETTIVYDQQDGSIIHKNLIVGRTTHLYPIFRAVKWISYYSGPTGSGATYFSDTSYYDGVGPQSLPGSIMSRDGNYTFEGWYVNATLDSSGETNVTGAYKIANANGELILTNDNHVLESYGLTIEQVAQVGSPGDSNYSPAYNYIKLNGARVNLYANWTKGTEAIYTYVIVKQKAQDAVGLSAAEKQYEFSESFQATGTFGTGHNIPWDPTGAQAFLTQLNTAAGYNALHPDPDAQLMNDEDSPYYGYHFVAANDFSRTSSQVEILEDGSAILYIRYDWDAKPDTTNRYFTLTFADSREGEEASVALPIVYDGSDTLEKIRWTDALEQYVPTTYDNGYDENSNHIYGPKPKSGREGYTFTGWFADKECTTRAFFHEPTEEDLKPLKISGTDHYQPYAVFTTMPGTDVTFYAGWEVEWYVVTIDPNYGALHEHVYTDADNGDYSYVTDPVYNDEHELIGEKPRFTGNGSTWFWSAYGGRIQEYTTVRRDFVESESGSWYYVNHKGNGQGGSIYADRYTYYTKDPSEATEFTTFEEQDDVYRYAGWYEVLFDENGNEIGEAEHRFDFSSIVNRNITLRLRWMKVGVFYMQYNAGEGTLSREDENEKLFIELDGETYSDDADVLVTRIANPPEGYEFVGWKIRNDDSGAIYRPGETFHLSSVFMVTVQGKRTVFLDAVYEKVPTATVVYHGNFPYTGFGSVSTSIDTADLDNKTTEDAKTVYGYPQELTYTAYTVSYDFTTDPDDPTATIADLQNNGVAVLSDGASWLTSPYAVFAGWCEDPQLNPDNSDHPLLDGGEEYRIGANEGETSADRVVHLYAIWKVSVNYHLNNNTTGADFGGDWNDAFVSMGSTPYTLSADGKTYTQNDVLIGSTLGWPAHDPTSPDANETFLYWATKDANDVYTQYSFTQEITGSLDLYAYWGTAHTANVKVVDTSEETIVYAPWTPDTDSDSEPDGDATISLSSTRVTPANVAPYGASYTYNGIPYIFSFATVVNNAMGINYIQYDPISELYYKAEDGKVHLIYDRAENPDVALGDNQTIHFVYYSEKKIAIRYVQMNGNGTLTYLTPTAGAQTETGFLGGFESNGDLKEYIITDYVGAPVDCVSGTYPYYSYALGYPNATGAEQLTLKTNAFTDNLDRPRLRIRNTWRGFEYSRDYGVNWYKTEYDPSIYVVYYTEYPTYVTFNAEVIGLAADARTMFEFDYWIDKIQLSNGISTGNVIERTFTTRPDDGDTTNNDGAQDYLYHSGTTVEAGGGKTFTAFLLTDDTADYTFRVTAVQHAKDGCTTTVEESYPSTLTYATSLIGWDNSIHDLSRTYAYTADYNSPNYGQTQYVTFVNTRQSVTVEIHLAQSPVNVGELQLHDEYRTSTAANYTLSLNMGETKTLETVLPSTAFINNAIDHYEHTAIFYGSDGGNNGDLITVGNAPFDCDAIAFVKPQGSDVYSVCLKNSQTNALYPLSELSEQIGGNSASTPYKIYYLYTPLLTIYYVWEDIDGTLHPITGANGGDVTYEGAPMTMNGLTVTQQQGVSMPLGGMTISQEIAAGIFNIPPLLDNGDNQLDLVYSKMGATVESDYHTVRTNISDLDIPYDPENPGPTGVSENLILYLQLNDSKLQWKFDYEDWYTLDNWPIVYAIYRERGYNLTVSKTMRNNESYNEPFTVTIESPAISRRSYPVTGTGYNYISATTAAENNGVGVITFEVKDGDSITIIGLAPGTYTVNESGHENFVLSTEYRLVHGNTHLEPVTPYDASNPPDASTARPCFTDADTVEFVLSDNTELALINTAEYICKVDHMKFYTITDAVEYIATFDQDFTATIEMLKPEYLMPNSDTPEIPAYLHITLTTAAPDDQDSDNEITAGATAVIKRKNNLTGSMFDVADTGELILTNITLDGNVRYDENNDEVPYPAALIHNEGVITVSTGATLKDGHTQTTQNGTVVGNGGAIESLKGTVNVTGGVITGCTAVNGGAIYAASGAVNVSGGTIKGCEANLGGAIYYAGSDRVIVTGGVIGTSAEPNQAVDGGALYMASGTVDITGGTVAYNRATNDGGAVFALNAYVNISGNNTSISNNRAAGNGGAVHMETLTLKVEGGTISHNSAADGGAVWAGTGSVELSGGSMSNNNATTGSGGAVYTDASAFLMTGGTISDNTAAQHGGGVYAHSGAVTVTPANSTETGIHYNTATNGNGGGIYAGSGTVSITTKYARMYGNRAENGNGGGLYIDSGAATLQDCHVGQRNGDDSALFNRAINGAGVFVNRGSLTLKDEVFIRQNRASNGGGLGVGSMGARVYFSGSVRVQLNYNTASGSDVLSNVYLNFDTDTILNFTSVGSSADIGIYVADAEVPTRGVPSARFGVYTGNLTLAKIKNDRTANMTVAQDASNKKVYWTRNFSIKVYYVPDYRNGLPFSETDYTHGFTNAGSNGSSYIRSANGTPPEYQSSISDVAADIREKGAVAPSGNTTAVLGNAYVKPNQVIDLNYGDYLTDINWNTTNNLWDFVKRDGTSVYGGSTTSDTKTLIFIFTEPYFLSIENNYREGNQERTLVISDLSVTVNGATQSLIENYGYLFAVNDEIQDDLRPVTADDLVLESGDSIRILIPGGKGMPYSLTGKYYTSYDPDHPNDNVASGTVGYRQRLTTDTAPDVINANGSVNASAVSVGGEDTDVTPSNSGQTHELIFGGDRAICRVVANMMIPGVNAGEYVACHAGEGATTGKWEYTFNSPRQANAFITTHHDGFWKDNDSSTGTIQAVIELLVDYMYPASEQTNLSTGGGIKRDITFQTSVSGYYRYDMAHTNENGPTTDSETGEIVASTNPRAMVSRGSGNTTNFILAPAGTLQNGDYVDKLTVKNLIFDGKNFGGDNIMGGIIKTKGWNVEISNADFKNCRARYGGGIFIESIYPEPIGEVNTLSPYGHLTVSDCNFTNCQSLEGRDKFGGGAIWTSMKEMTLTDCTFSSCAATATIGGAASAQGGAVFHCVLNPAANVETLSEVTGCTFDNCYANAGGSMECGAKTIRVTGCEFRNSTATSKNGGAFNAWVYNSQNSEKASYVYVTDCRFENCYCVSPNNASNGNGGAFRSTATNNIVTNCTFINNLGALGGAINITNQYADLTYISGSTFNECSAAQGGGAIYCSSKTLIIDAIDHSVDPPANPPVATANGTEFRNCRATQQGGAVYHNCNKSGRTLMMSDCTVDTCSTTTEEGGGVYTNAYTVSIVNSTIQNCYTVGSAKNGGGVYLSNATNTTISGTNILNNTTTGIGGGVYHVNGSSVNGGTFSVLNNSTISGNIADSMDTTTGNSGGGIYTIAKTFTLQDSSVTNNQGYGNGGGICQNYSGSDGLMTIDGATVTGNIAGHIEDGTGEEIGKGGGLYTLTNMLIKGITTVTGNRLKTEAAQDAAGVYLRDGVNLSLGATGETKAQNVYTIKNNLTVDGKLSDLRLPDKDEFENDNKVKVLCGIDGEVYVVNAKKKLTQFGAAQGTLESPAGFTDEKKVFWSEDKELYGIVDRQDANYKKIIWGGDPICKITDANNRLLYIDKDGIRPALFDRLDALTDSHTTDTTTTSAFSTLRRVGAVTDANDSDYTGHLYYADGTKYTGSVYQVKMLIESYEEEYYMEAQVGKNASASNTIILTTAKKTDSMYPYTGREGTRCTITRSPQMSTAHAMVTTASNLTLENIVLDGNSSNVTAGGESRIISANTSIGGEAIKSANPINVILNRNATIQNATVVDTASTAESDGNGGGVYVNWSAQLTINGGTIRNCKAVDGGAVYINGRKGTMTMTVGTITKCEASRNGGGVFFKSGYPENSSEQNPTVGVIRISGGSISRCSAVNGGGIYLNSLNDTSRRLYMSGGSIGQNHASGIAGGIYVGDSKARLIFSGAPYVYGNTGDNTVIPKDEKDPSKDCIPPYANADNIRMAFGFNRSALNPATVIVSRGLTRGASVGVYVPDTASDVNGAGGTLYGDHGAELDPFATFDANTSNSNRGLNYYINDRNGMKGGQYDDPVTGDQKIYWRIIYALSVTKEVMTDDEDDDHTIFRFAVQLTGSIPATDTSPQILAQDVNMTYGDMSFTNGRASFTLRNGETKIADLLPLGFGYEITEVFLDSEEASKYKTTAEDWNHTVTQGASMTGLNRTLTGSMNNATNYTYNVTFSNMTAVCKIVGINSEGESQLLYIYNESTDKYSPAVYSELARAFSDMNRLQEWYYKTDTGAYLPFYPDSYRIEMLVPEYDQINPVGVSTGRTVTLTTAATDADDGFHYVGGNEPAKITRSYTGNSMIKVTDGDLTLSNITLNGGRRDGYQATENGGIVSVVQSGAKLTVGDGVTLKDSTTTQNGPCIYLAEGSRMFLSGGPVFENNAVAFAQMTAKNGNESAYADGTVRQDIYIDGYQGTNAASLVVTGDITSGPGSIWVWAEEDPHYIQNQQFAVLSGGVHDGLDAFRNAQTDTATQNPLVSGNNIYYLYGVARDGKVFWSGCMDLVITKQVEGGSADPNEAFSFTVSGLDSDYSRNTGCDITRYTTTDGVNWTLTGTGKLYATGADNSITFTLTHYQKIVISVPRDLTVTVTETNGRYRARYSINGETEVEGSGSTITTSSITMNQDQFVAFTNRYELVSPSGVTFRVLPFALMLAGGLVMVMIVAGVRRRKKEEEESA